MELIELVFTELQSEWRLNIKYMHTVNWCDQATEY